MAMEGTMVTDTITLWEELRFAKRQQWTITAAVVALIGSAYSIAREGLVDWEKSVITILIVVAVIGAIYWLCDLQRHLYRTRLDIDQYDPDPWWRGADVARGMVGAMVISAFVVCYLLLRDGAYEMLFAICLAFATLPMGF
jgi:hypothetical protein